jgi:hypothetical protein
MLIHLHSLVADDMPQELNLGLAELAITELSKQIVFSQAHQRGPQVMHVFLLTLAIHQDVVQVHHYKVSHFRLIYRVQQLLEHCWCVAQTESQDVPLVVPERKQLYADLRV